ncbi:MAG: PAS domain S-box protein, partial [Thermoleophilaceae bacterium]
MAALVLLLLLLLLVVLLLAGLLLWRFRSARGELARLSRQVEIEAAGRAAASQSEQRFRRFADHAADGFFLIARNGRIVDVNRAACESLGYARQELLELTVHDIAVGSTRASFERRWQSTP